MYTHTYTYTYARERYNSCAHKIKRKRVLKENRIGTPPQRQVAGAISSRRRTHAHYYFSVFTNDGCVLYVFFFFFVFLPFSPSLSLSLSETQARDACNDNTIWNRDLVHPNSFEKPRPSARLMIDRARARHRPFVFSRVRLLFWRDEQTIETSSSLFAFTCDNVHHNTRARVSVVITHDTIRVSHPHYARPLRSIRFLVYVRYYYYCYYSWSSTKTCDATEPRRRTRLALNTWLYSPISPRPQTSRQHRRRPVYSRAALIISRRYV